MRKFVRIEGEGLRRAQKFGIPESEVGALIVSFPLSWAWVEDRLQAVIVHEGVRYPRCRMATQEELLELMRGVA